MYPFVHRRSVSSGLDRRGPRSRASFVLPRLFAVALAALVALPMAEATQPVAASKKFKTITKTISNTAPISVPGAGTSGPGSAYPATIDVTAFGKFQKAQIKDVNLTLLNLTHTFPDNVDVMLVLGNRQATIYERLNFNFMRDVAPVAGLIRGPLVMVLHRRFRPRRSRNSSPMPGPTWAPSTWDRRATARRAICPANCSKWRQDWTWCTCRTAAVRPR